MKLIKLSTLSARPAVILSVIIVLCLCSMLVSVYYVHNFAVASPIELMQANGEWGQTGILGADDNHQPKIGIMSLAAQKTHRVGDGPMILNNIDIASHIEAMEEKQEKASPQNKPLPIQGRPVKKEDMWPERHKIYKKEKQDYVPLEVQIYNVSQRTRKDWNGERYIVYLCHSNLTCAGWGDRQHGIFSAYLLSLVTNRTFKVDMQSPCSLAKLYHPRILNWKVNQSAFDGLSSTHLYVLNDRKFRDSVRVLDFNSMYPQDVVYLTTNYDYFYGLKGNPLYKTVFKQKVKSRPRPILFADLWQSIFKMNKRVVRRYSSAIKNAWPSKKHKLVCAHIRFGKNPTIPTDGDVRNTLSSIKPLWDFLKQYSDASKYRLFVASDWEGFREKVQNHFRDMSVDVKGDIIHIDKTKGLVKKENRTSSAHLDLCNGFEKVIADQYVLSKCDILLLTYSVFGKAAAYLRRSNRDLYLLENGNIKPLMLFNEKNVH